MKPVVIGLLAALVVVFPHQAGQAATLLIPALNLAARWTARQPAVWAFATGALVGPRIARRLTRRPPGTA
jgi:hypothetical protein